jgi:hypothetical protein
MRGRSIYRGGRREGEGATAKRESTEKEASGFRDDLAFTVDVNQ